MVLPPQKRSLKQNHTLVVTNSTPYFTKTSYKKHITNDMITDRISKKNTKTKTVLSCPDYISEKATLMG